MGVIRQLWLPKLSAVKKLTRARRFPQPRIDEFKIIKQYEIFHRPFDLKFRGRINEWLNQIKLTKKFQIRQVLDNKQYKVVRLYFFPQEANDKWLNQKEVLEKIGKKSKKKLRATLVSALIRIWKAERAIDE